LKEDVQNIEISIIINKNKSVLVIEGAAPEQFSRVRMSPICTMVIARVV